jgi:hypothetical protein
MGLRISCGKSGDMVRTKWRFYMIHNRILTKSGKNMISQAAKAMATMALNRMRVSFRLILGCKIPKQGPPGP